MLFVCPKCHFFGKTKNNYSDDDLNTGLFWTIMGVLGLIIGLFFYGDISGSKTIYFIIILFVLGSGIRRLIRRRQGSICPNCNHKPMLTMDNPEAIKLIKKYDLEPGENNVVKNENESDETKAPTT